MLPALSRSVGLRPICCGDCAGDIPVPPHARALYVGTATALDYSPVRYWDTDDVMPETTNADTRYATQIRRAAEDYTDNTDLAVDYCSSSCTDSNIRHCEADYGNTTWAARVQLSPPVITYATVQWNAHWGQYNNFVANRLASHEMGHAFGLEHSEDCGTVTPQLYAVMGCPEPNKVVLHDHNIEDIDNRY